MQTVLSILYLHGFASSPQSRKARFFAGRLSSLYIPVQVLDLAQGQFESLTVRRQLDLIEQQVSAAPEPVTLIGSSLGGYLAALYAARHRNINRLLLLAPAFGFRDLWMSALGTQRVAEWKRLGSMNVFHFGEGREMPLRFHFLEDAAGFEAFPKVAQPTLIFHGERDDVVPVAQSIRYQRVNPQARLVRFAQAGHELTEVLEEIWSGAKDFLLPGA